MPIRSIARRLLSLALWLCLSLPLLWPQPSWAASSEVAGSRGAQLFGQHCAGCHVNGGNIIRRSNAQVLGKGAPEAVGNYVWQQAQAGWPRK